MSEKRYKRFYVSESENQLTIYDNEGLDDYYHLGNDERDVKGICKLLNTQQSTIIHLEKVNGKNFAKRRLLEQDNLVLRNENEQLRKELKNRSAFIIDKGLGDTFVRWKNE